MHARGKWFSTVLVAAVAAGMLAGCTANEGGGRSSAKIAEGAPDAPMGGRAGSGEQRKPSVPAEQITAGQRKLARTASMSIETSDVTSAARRAGQYATDSGGYVAEARTAGGSATLELAVPSQSLDPVVADLRTLGEVVSFRRSTTDVTAKVVDVQARLASQRASVRRVRQLLDEATDISEIVAIETELADRQAALESLQARYETLTDRVAMSTVTLHLSTATATAQDDTDIAAGLFTGWEAFLDFSAATLTVLAAALPFLAFLGAPAALLAWYLRRRRAAADGG